MTASVIPFPASTRAVLQPSAHARGMRPFTFGGRLAEDVAPGIAHARTETVGAIDVAWLVERSLGRAAFRAPQVWPGVPGAVERAQQIGAAAGAYPFQQGGAGFLAERDFAVLSWGMGVGKTLTSIIAAEARLSFASVPSPLTPCVLVIAPALAKRHWQREIRRWSGHDAAIIDGLRPGPIPEARYVICNYDILAGARRRNESGVLQASAELPGWGDTLKGRFLIAIIDESHTVRGRSSQRLKAVKQTLKGVVAVWLLSGTLMPNYVRDLWAQIDLATDGLHGGYWPWARAYCAAFQGQYGWNDLGADRLEELANRMTFFVSQVRTADVLTELPEKRREVLRIDVDVTAPHVHEGDEPLSRRNAVARALRITARAKRGAAVAQTVEALEAKQKVVVFTYLREQTEQIAKAVKAETDGIPIQCVHGDLSPEGRDAQAQAFREAPAPAAFIATIDSVGLAISLVGADLALYADLTWEPHKLLQTEARCHRHGTTNRVIVRYLIASGTIDEGIAESVIAKLATLEQAFGKDADADNMSTMLGGNRDDSAVIDSLFSRLKSWEAAP